MKPSGGESAPVAMHFVLGNSFQAFGWNRTISWGNGLATFLILFLILITLLIKFMFVLNVRQETSQLVSS